LALFASLREIRSRLPANFPASRKISLFVIFVIFVVFVRNPLTQADSLVEGRVLTKLTKHTKSTKSLATEAQITRVI
jgi:hypothetical protein